MEKSGNKVLEKVYVDFHALLLKYVSARVNSPEDAADIVQEVFVKAAIKMDSLEDDQKVKGWILTIARNTIIDYYRKRANHNESTMPQDILEEMRAEETTSTIVALDKCVKGFIGALPEDYRKIILDSEIKGIRQKDLAEKYGLAYSSVRSRVQRGRSRLKDMFLKCCEIELDQHGNILEATPRQECKESCAQN